MKQSSLVIGFTLFCASFLMAATPDPLQHEAYLKAFSLIQSMDPSQKSLSTSVSLDDLFIDLAKQTAITGDDQLFWELLRYAEKTPKLALANQRVFSVVLIDLIERNHTETALAFFEKCPDDRKLIVGKPVFIALIYRNQLEDAKTLIAMLPAGFQTQQLMIELAQAYFKANEFQKTIDIILPLPNSPQKQTLLTATLKEMIARGLMEELALTEYRSYLSPENDQTLDLLQEQTALDVDHGDEILNRALTFKLMEQQELLLSPLVALYVQNNRLDDAKAVISRVSAKELRDALQFRFVKELINVKNKSEAVKSVQGIRDPAMNADAYFELSKELVKEDRFEDAMVLMKQAKASEFGHTRMIDLAAMFAESPRYLAATMAFDEAPAAIKDQALSAYILALSKKNYDKAKELLPKLSMPRYRQRTEEKMITFLLDTNRVSEALALAKGQPLETKPESLLRVAERAMALSNASVAKEALLQTQPLLLQIADLGRLSGLAQRLADGYAATKQTTQQKAFIKQFEPYLKKTYQKSPLWPNAQLLMAQIYLKAGDFNKSLSIAKSLKDPLLEAKLLIAAPPSRHLTAEQLSKGQKAIQKLK